jgi:hypothetical protein
LAGACFDWVAEDRVVFFASVTEDRFSFETAFLGFVLLFPLPSAPPDRDFF